MFGADVLFVAQRPTHLVELLYIELLLYLKAQNVCASESAECAFPNGKREADRVFSNVFFFSKSSSVPGVIFIQVRAHK